ncbi:MAG TPA: hypothetical protein VF988_05995 [Verrucomicrobiae bacterium]
MSASATFTFGAGTLTIVLQNLQTSVNSPGQAVCGVEFNGLAGSTLSSAVGQLTSYNGNSWSAPGSPTSLTHWAIDGNGDLWTLTGGKPDELIVGPNGAGNGGVGNFDPYVYESATFVLRNASFTAASTISGDVTFQFGTQAEGLLYTSVSNPQGGGQPVPEPSTAIAAALLALPLGVGTLRWLRETAPTAPESQG